MCISGLYGEGEQVFGVWGKIFQNIVDWVQFDFWGEFFINQVISYFGVFWVLYNYYDLDVYLLLIVFCFIIYSYYCVI